MASRTPTPAGPPPGSPINAPADFDAAEAAMGLGLERNAEAGNYLAWLAELCTPYLGASVLELGSGFGDLTERIAVGRKVRASDLSQNHIDRLEQRFAGNDNVTVSEIDASDLHLDAQYDSIVMMNVLEHLADDRDALRSLRQALVPGGRLVVYVPAFMLLYSKFDREIGHYRRYRKAPLCRLFEDTGFRVVDSRYVNSVGALGWLVYCRLLGRKSSDQITVSTCDRVVVPVVRSVERRFPPPFGLSVLVVGERVGD